MPRITTHSKQREFTSPQNVPYCPCFSKIQFSSSRKAAALWWSPYIDFPFSEPIKWESNVCNLLGSGLFYWRKCSYSFINRFFLKKKTSYCLERTFVFYEDWSDFYFAKLLLPSAIHLRDLFVLFCFYSGQNIHCLG